jgi:hypothetical protein
MSNTPRNLDVVKKPGGGAAFFKVLALPFGAFGTNFIGNFFHRHERPLHSMVGFFLMITLAWAWSLTQHSMQKLLNMNCFPRPAIHSQLLAFHPMLPGLLASTLRTQATTHAMLRPFAIPSTCSVEVSGGLTLVWNTSWAHPVKGKPRCTSSVKISDISEMNPFGLFYIGRTVMVDIVCLCHSLHVLLERTKTNNDIFFVFFEYFDCTENTVRI